jgi:hypothetical protein
MKWRCPISLIPKFLEAEDLASVLLSSIAFTSQVKL